MAAATFAGGLGGTASEVWNSCLNRLGDRLLTFLSNYPIAPHWPFWSAPLGQQIPYILRIHSLSLAIWLDRESLIIVSPLKQLCLHKALLVFQSHIIEYDQEHERADHVGHTIVHEEALEHGALETGWVHFAKVLYLVEVDNVKNYQYDKEHRIQAQYEHEADYESDVHTLLPGKRNPLKLSRSNLLLYKEYQRVVYNINVEHNNQHYGWAHCYDLEKGLVEDVIFLFED